MMYFAIILLFFVCDPVLTALSPYLTKRCLCSAEHAPAFPFHLGLFLAFLLCAINSISIYYVFDLDVHIHSTELKL